MGLLEVKNISHTFGDKVLYDKASFEIFKGEHVGLVGQNGAGKTTLLRSLIGEVIPDEGEIKWQKGIRKGYLDQHANIDNNLTIKEYLKTAFDYLYKVEAELNELYSLMAQTFTDEIFEKSTNYQSLLENSGFYEIDSTILKVCDGLGISAIGIDKQLGKLSGGQKAKVILAKLLLQKPDMLLLDEPTNFLDKEHIKWLENYLKTFKGAFIVISHDFDFLDQITTVIVDIEFRNIKKYTGNFSKFIKQKNISRESYIKEFKSQQKQIKKYEDFIAKNRVRASTAKQAQSRIKALNKMKKLPPPEFTVKPNFSFKCSPIDFERALLISKLKVGYTAPLLPAMTLEIKAKEKIAFTGFNGIGKSTLLKTLVGEIKPISGWFHFFEEVKIAYFEQDLKWEDNTVSALEEISNDFPNLSQTEIRKNLSKCGLKSEHVFQPISTLSGGEQAKIKICKLMLTSSNFLILDEPTNHLDADSKALLKEELLKWSGNLILVSHEESFYDGLCNKIINIKK